MSSYSLSEKMDLTSAIMRLPSELGTVHTGTYWQQKLQAAQNVLFCKEIFSQVNKMIASTFILNMCDIKNWF